MEINEYQPDFNRYIGFHDCSHHASVATITESSVDVSFEIHLLERLTRIKADPGPLLAHLSEIFQGTPSTLSKIGIDIVSIFPWRPQNHNVVADRRPHHECHALAATMVSPFQKSVIVVNDGAGTCSLDIPPGHPELKNFSPLENSSDDDGRYFTESYSVYLQDGPTVKCVDKGWQIHTGKVSPILWRNMGMGMLYGLCAEYIFGSHLHSGKVMGLAAFGTATPIDNATEYYLSLAPEKAFRDNSKRNWEKSPHRELYADIAATTQGYFEKKLLDLLLNVREKFGDYDNLILTGGCALNCQANQKILDKKLYSAIYVPPFPGDESVALGAAASHWLKSKGRQWRPIEFANQNSNFGPRRSNPKAHKIENVFSKFKVTKMENVAEVTASILNEGHLVAWFQGRSESGPRALGYRSILGDPRIQGLKKDLNERIKRRENFRPYACAIPQQEVAKYFHVDSDFESPFMSFSPSVREEYRDTLSEVIHIDGTSRLQTVRQTQNPQFYDLLMAFGKKTGLYCLLNTSLNVMGEPIAETISDARRFLETVPVNFLVVEDYLIQKE